MTKITEADIRKYDNVPVDIAAEYLGVYAGRLREALKKNLLPTVGVAVTNGKAMFIISPGGLIAWKTGKAPLHVDHIEHVETLEIK